MTELSDAAVLDGFIRWCSAGSASASPARPSRRRRAGRHRGGARHADRRAHRLGQDARGVPRRASTDSCARALRGRARRRAPQVVYVSPLKALANDIQQNLEAPLAEIARARRGEGVALPDDPRRGAHRRHAGRRARDDGASGRRTSWSPRPSRSTSCSPREQGREALAHGRDGDRRRDPRGRARQARRAPRALARAARRAVAQTRRAPGASASRPRSGRSSAIARLLVGDAAAPLPHIVDAGHRRDLDLAHRAPRRRARRGRVARAVGPTSTTGSPSSSREHRTTLVFVNTRRLAERVAHELGERLGDDAVAAHHGSLSHELPARGRAAAEGRRAPGAGRDRVARARHRHRPGRPRLPDRLAALHRDVPAARRPLRPRPAAARRRAGCSR